MTELELILTEAGATLEWPAQLSTAKSYRIEERRLGIDDQGHLRTSWEQPRTVRVTESKGRFFAEMGGLKPDSRHTVRLLPVLGDEVGEPIFITQFQTAPPKAPLAATPTQPARRYTH